METKTITRHLNRLLLTTIDSLIVQNTNSYQMSILRRIEYSSAQQNFSKGGTMRTYWT